MDLQLLAQLEVQASTMSFSGKLYVQVYDREFEIREIIEGLLGLRLSPASRRLVRRITEEREKATRENLPPPAGGDVWYMLNAEHGGTAERAAIPTRTQLWKIFSESGVEGIKRALPKSKYPDDVLVQLALWGGCVDELDLYGFIIQVGYEPVLEACKSLANEGLIVFEEYEGIVPTGEHGKSIVVRVKSPKGGMNERT